MDEVETHVHPYVQGSFWGFFCGFAYTVYFASGFAMFYIAIGIYQAVISALGCEKKYGGIVGFKICYNPRQLEKYAAARTAPFAIVYPMISNLYWNNDWWTS